MKSSNEPTIIEELLPKIVPSEEVDIIYPNIEIDEVREGDHPLYSVGRGPKYHSGAIYIIKGEAIKFVYRVGAYLNDDAADRAIIDRGQTNFPSHVFNDLKYWEELDTRSNNFLLMGWYSRDTGNYGWVGVLNTEDTWWFRKNGAWTKLHSNNGSNFGAWTIGGSYITIFAKNPKNVGGWTPNDIVYRYGWSYTLSDEKPNKV